MIRPIQAAATLAPAALLTACIIPFNGPGDIRRDIEAHGHRLDRSFGLTVGRSGMAIARWAVRHAEDEDIPIRGIRKVEIGVYEIKERSADATAFTAADWPEWSPMVEVYKEDSVLILSRGGKLEGSIRKLLFVVEDEDELVLLRLTGKLESFIEDAITFGLKEAERPELVGPAIADYREHFESREAAL